MVVNFSAQTQKQASCAWREPLANLLLCAYMALIIFLPEAYEQWFRQPLLEETRLANKHSAVSVKFALLLLGLQGLEFIALKWKTAAVFFRLQGTALSLRFGLGIFIFWLFHMAVSIMLAASACLAFETDLTSGGGWTALVFFTVIGKEMILLSFLLDLWGNDSTNPLTQGWREGAADVLLLVFNIVAYTSLWESVVFEPQNSLLLHWNQPVFLFVETIAAFLLVCMTILPFKIPWLTEIWARRAFDRSTGQAALSLCLLFFVAISPLLAGEHDLAQALHEPEQVYRLFLPAWPGATLPGEIEKLQELQVLVIERSQLRAIPPQIGELTDLTALILRQNQLAGLPPELGRLHQLRVLDVSDNRLQKLPQVLPQLGGLKELRLKGNPLLQAEVEALRKKMPQTRIVF